MPGGAVPLQPLPHASAVPHAGGYRGATEADSSSRRPQDKNRCSYSSQATCWSASIAGFGAVVVIRSRMMAL